MEKIKVKLKYKDEYGDLSKLTISVDELSNFKLANNLESASNVYYYSTTHTDKEIYEYTIIEHKKGYDK